MSRAIVFSVLLLPLLSQVCASQSNDLTSLGIMRPVKQLPREPRHSADITFEDFQIQQTYLTNHPGTVEIKGEPTKGGRFFARAWIFGWEAIATLKFEAVDENGKFIDKVLINREAGPNGDSDFYGVIKIPDRPFRVVMSGEGWDGKSFTRTFKRLFKPTTRRQDPILIPDGNSRVDARIVQSIDDYMKKVEEDAMKNSAEMIVMPRTRVSNVMYAPYFSKSGRQLGIRITYDVEFSHDGYYNPELVLFLDYKKDDWRGQIEMTPLTGSIDPQPKETGEPQNQKHLLENNAGYLYSAGTKYHFTAEYIPDFVIQNEQKTRFCIYYQKYNYAPETQTAFKEILADNRPTPYTLEIKNTDFFGVIEGLASQGTLLKSFLAMGATDCGPQPTTRF